MPQNILTVENSAVSVLLFQALNAGKLTGPMAQRIRHLTTNQGIAGSSPARVKFFFYKTIIVSKTSRQDNYSLSSVENKAEISCCCERYFFRF